jgi:hypothetical protein
MAMRTSKGNVTASARKKHGDEQGKFPVFDHKSAMSAIKLRHNGKGVSAASVLSKVARWASAHSDKAVLNAVAAARQADKQKK